MSKGTRTILRSFLLLLAFALGAASVVVVGRLIPRARSILLRAVEGDHAMDMEPGMSHSGHGAVKEPPTGKRILYWKSSMNPGEIHQAPGKDSMGMDLVPVYEGEEGSAGEIRIDPATQQNMGVRIAKVTRGPLKRTVRTVAYIAYDETTLGNVNLKVSGWIEKLYVEKTGEQVHEDDPLFEIYSPELYSAQEEYLSSIRRSRQPVPEPPQIPQVEMDTRGLLESSRTRLRLFDITEDQIAEIEKSGKVSRTLLVRAPRTGIVIHKGVVEGQHVKAGEDVFRIADLSRVWVQARVYEYDVPFVKEGQEARMALAYLPGRTYLGKVTYIYPYLESGTREVSVRMEFPNPGYILKPGMYATVELQSLIEKDAVLVASEAVIRTGGRDVAFVARGGGHFEARDLHLGLTGAENEIQVLGGLEPGEEVVLSGQFLIDSESRLREAALKMLEPGEMSKGKVLEPGGREKASTDQGKKPGAVRHERSWVCPMPEHASILYDSPGNCPICKSMKLVPAPEED